MDPLVVTELLHSGPFGLMVLGLAFWVWRLDKRILMKDAQLAAEASARAADSQRYTDFVERRGKEFVEQVSILSGVSEQLKEQLLRSRGR